MIKKIKWKSKKRSDWLEQRSTLQGLGNYEDVRFGSSDISTIMGENKWSSRKKLFWNLLGFYRTDLNSFKVEMGQRTELLNKESFECFLPNDKDGFDTRFCKGDRLRKLKNPTYFLTNTKFDHSFSSVDFILPKKSICPFTGEITTKERPVETKAVNFNSYSTWKGKPGMYYYIQVQHQIAVMDSDAGYLSCIISGDQYDCFYIPRDEEMITRIDEAASDFKLRLLQAKQVLKLYNETEDQEFKDELWSMIVNLEPEPTGFESDLEFVANEFFPETNSLEMQGTEEDQKLIDRYINAKIQEDEAKKEKTLVKTLLTESMQTFEILKTKTNKVINRRTFEGKNYFSVK